MQALDRLAIDLEQGVTYEAHEMVKTAYYRFRARRKLEESYDVAAVRDVLNVSS